jgi:DNA polymerase
MATTSSSPLHQQIAAAQAWWRDAGVDCDFTDEPMNWLQSDAPETAAQAVPPPVFARKAEPAVPPPPALLDKSVWPTTLDAFASWWLSEPKLDEGGLSPRVAPRGKPGAEMMILVEQPEQEDGERLLSGRQGALLAAMLVAMGLGEADIYLAAALPRHTPMADWNAMRINGLADVLRHHVALAAPRRLLLLGPQLLPLLGHDPAQNPASFSEVALENGPVAALASRDLASLLNRPRWRADFWRRWLEWSEGTGV